MSNRKNWTQKEDQVLRYLIQEQKLTKWAQIAHIMATKYNYLCNQKQCRGRYLHKLAKTANSTPLTLQQENQLFHLQELYGNKWAQIATRLSRTDNYVKNYFYAKLRRCLRKVNKLIGKFLSSQYHKVETTVLYKIIESLDHSEQSKKIKDILRQYEDLRYEQQDLDEKINFAREIAGQFAIIEPNIRKDGRMVDQGLIAEKRGRIMEYDSESQYSSHHNTINSYNTSSRSNSHSNSSRSSCKNTPPVIIKANNNLLKPMNIKRSQSIEEEELRRQQRDSLFKSSDLDNRNKENKIQLVSQNYVANLDMLQEIDNMEFIQINFISPKISSSSSQGKIQIEDYPIPIEINQNIINEDNLWEIMEIPSKNPFQFEQQEK